ncbi:MAG: hypothetical protein ACO3GP_07650 [Candidatus Limnocylindrus sp.]
MKVRQNLFGMSAFDARMLRDKLDAKRKIEELERALGMSVEDAQVLAIVADNLWGSTLTRRDAPTCDSRRQPQTHAPDGLADD